MARMARLVVPGHPHHVTQRGVRRLDVFLQEDDTAPIWSSWAAGAAPPAPRSGPTALCPIMFISSWCRPARMACAPPWARPIGAIPAISMTARTGAGICGRSVSTPSSWTRITFSPARGMWSSIQSAPVSSRSLSIGHGRAPGPISMAPITVSSPSNRCSLGCRIGGPFSMAASARTRWNESGIMPEPVIPSVLTAISPS